MLGKIASPPQVGPGKCILAKNETSCTHPNAVYMNGLGVELDHSDGDGAWWVKHSWVLGGEGYQNWELKPKKNDGDGQSVDGVLLEDGITMKIGTRNDPVFKDYNLSMPIVDTTTMRVNYENIRYQISDETGAEEEAFKLVWKCKRRKSAFTGGIRTRPMIN